MEVERCQGNEDDPHEHSHQHEEREGGRERREDAELLRAGAVAGVEPSVAALRRRHQPRGLGGSRRHPVLLVSPAPSSPVSLTPDTLRALWDQRGDTGARMWLPAPERRYM